MSIEARFKKFHADNPDVFHQLVALAREAKASGLPKCGARMLWEVLRWQRLRTAPRGPEAKPFKLNDHFPPYYARMIETTYPAEFAGFFEFRNLRAQGAE